MRNDLAFFMCCCKSFLGSDDPANADNYYELLQINNDATQDEIKRAYKKQSLLMHPDKLAQRGLTVTAADQAKFTRMKEAYEVLSDPHKRETYDAIGARGMKWLEEPFSIDPQELAHNFAKSSIIDRSKIFAIFVSIAVAVLLQPALICMHVDGDFGPNASWIATFIPLWIWNLILIFYHTRVIMMGPIPKPDHIPENEWVDPLPMNKRIFSMARFLLIVLFELLVAFKLDHIIRAPWSAVFIPLYAWELTTLYKKLPLARMRIVTVEDLEAALGKPFSEFTPAEKELIGQRYSVVSSTNSPDFDAAQKLKTRARHDIIKSIFRIGFVIVLLLQLDGNMDWNWWLVFMPFWIMTLAICYANYQAFAEVQKSAAEKDPTLFGMKEPPKGNNPDDVETGKTSSYYGALGDNGFLGGFGTASKPNQTGTTNNVNTPPTPELTEEEREELKAQVMASSSRLCSKCCFQGFILIIFFLFVAKLQGAGFSSFLIISPFLLIAGLILCCLGCAIFGVTEVSTDGIDFESTGFDYTNAEQGGGLKPTPVTTTTDNQGQSNNTPENTGYIPLTPTILQPVYVQPTPAESTTNNTGTASSAELAVTAPSEPIVPTQPTSQITGEDQSSAIATSYEKQVSLVAKESSFPSSTDIVNKENDDEIPGCEVHDLD